jgi:hypothetical protein
VGHFDPDSGGALDEREAEMTAAERRWTLVYSLILIALTTIPAWIGFGMDGGGWRYSGFVVGVEDGNSYIAKMLLGQGGAWLFKTPYTGMDQRGVVAFLPFLLLGKLASSPGLHLQLVLLYHFFRIAMIPLVVVATYRFAAVFLPGEHWRRWATILVTAGGGLGWVLLLAGGPQEAASLPLEYISPESFGFLALFTLPHLALTRALVLIALTTYLRSAEQSRAGWRAGLILSLSILVQPLPAVTGLILIGAHQLLLYLRGGSTFLKNWRSAWWPVLWRMALPVFPLLAYYAIAFSTDPYLKLWSAQNQLPSPPPAYYLLAYGLLLPFSGVGIVRTWRDRNPNVSLLVAWILVFPFLAYFPYPVQRRLPEGVWVAISILAVMGFADLRARSRWIRVVQPLILVISLVSSITLLAGGISVAASPAQPAYVLAGDAEAYAWLASQAETGELVLASYATGNVLPAWAEVRVLVGLGPESAGLPGLLVEIEHFYSGAWAEAEQAAFLSRHEIRWIMLGQGERALGGSEAHFPPGWVVAYDSGTTQVYHREGAP